MAASAPPSSKLQCIICEREFPGIEDLKCHIAGEHLDYFPVGCGHCNSWLPAESMLKMHVESRGHVPYKAKLMLDQQKEAQLSGIMQQITGTGATPRQPLQQQQQSNAENSAFKPPNHPAQANASAAAATQKTPQKPSTPNTAATAAAMQQLQQANNTVKQLQDLFAKVQQMGPDEALQVAKQNGFLSVDAFLAKIQTVLSDWEEKRAKIVASQQQQPHKPIPVSVSRRIKQTARKSDGSAPIDRKRLWVSALDAKTPADNAPANTPVQAIPSGVPCRSASTAPANAAARPTTVAPQQIPVEALQSVAAPPVAMDKQPVTIECVGSVPNLLAETEGRPMPNIDNAVGMTSLIPPVVVSYSAVDAKTSANAAPESTLAPVPEVPSGVPSRPASSAPAETPPVTTVIAPPIAVAPQQTPSEQLLSVAAPPVAMDKQPVTIECVGSVPNAVAEKSSMEDASGKPLSISQVAASEPSLSKDGAC